jgi:hypothetical protein
MATTATTDVGAATASDSTKVLSLPGELTFCHTFSIPPELVRLPSIAKGDIGFATIHSLVVGTLFLYVTARRPAFSIFHAVVAVVGILMIGDVPDRFVRLGNEI